MSAPRITLWTQPFKMAFRLSIRPFDDNSLNRQVVDIQAPNYRYITITPGALYILSSIVGRRMTEPARWILFDSLRDILNGNLRTQYPEKQDLLASTFGELLGVILLTQHLGGNVEIIRLLESNYGKMPDFLLIQTTTTAQTVHILECKGRVEDVHNINNRMTKYDLCHEIRRFRDNAIEQIQTMDFSQAKAGPRTVVYQSKPPFGISCLAATENVLISSVPDARIIDRCRSSVRFADRKKCGPKVTCKMCITNLQDPSQANVISVLHQREIASKSKLDIGLLSFIARYRSVQRAVWSGNDIFFEASLNKLIDHLSDEALRDVLPSAILMAITLIETAISEELTHAHLDISRLGVIAPEYLHGVIEQINNDFLRIYDAISKQPASRRQTIQTEMPDPINATLFSDTISSINLPSMEDDNVEQRNEGQDSLLDAQDREKPQWYAINQSIRQISDFIEKAYTKAKLLIGNTIQGDYIYGSVQHADHAIIVVRLTSAKMNYDALKYYVVGLITQLHSPATRPVRWQKEYFQDNDREKFFVGESWDEFPYPNSTNDLFPGITAWIARDGRAEIIVRRRDDRLL